MAFVEPVTLRDRGIRLEPLTLEHEQGLRAAAADGLLWQIRVTGVPEPEQTRTYIETALLLREQGSNFAFAVVDEATDRVLGTTSFHDIVPAVKRVEIGWTWYAKSVQRSHDTGCEGYGGAHPGQSKGLGGHLVGSASN